MHWDLIWVRMMTVVEGEGSCHNRLYKMPLSFGVLDGERMNRLEWVEHADRSERLQLVVGGEDDRVQQRGLGSLGVDLESVVQMVDARAECST